METNTMRRVNDNTIVLDGLIWTTNSDKIVKIKNLDNGFRVNSIKVEGIVYYPAGIDKMGKNKSYSLIIEKFF